MAQWYFDKDADVGVLADSTVTIIGYGNQGRSQALNLRDSGIKVIVGSRSDESAKQAAEDGFEVFAPEEATGRATIVFLLVPDEVMPSVFDRHIRPNLSPGDMLVFASGYNIHFKHIVAPDNDQPTTRSTVSGRAHLMTEVPTLIQQVAPGSVIQSGDIDWVRMRSDRLGRGVVRDAAKLTGMSPRRPLRVGQPIRLRDLRQPVVVEKNSLVTIVFESDRMVLTAQGRALEDGPSGRAIRVMNTSSNSVVNAVVRSPGTVIVQHLASAAVN